ncbi:hypothetical protein [Spirosoma lituiforme]
MVNTTQTVDGPNGTTITGCVTDVTGSGKITEIVSGGDVYEPCPYTGKFYKK